MGDAYEARVISAGQAASAGGNNSHANRSSHNTKTNLLQAQHTENNVEQQEMNDIQVRVINDTAAGGSAGAGRTRDSIEVAMASPEEMENLPLPSLPATTSSAQSNLNNELQQVTTHALINETAENSNGAANTNNEEVPQVKISNL